MRLFQKQFDIKKIIDNKKQAFFVFAVILFAITVRIIQFGSLPAGLNQDEAYAGYEAYSMLHYGMDSSGYSNPCYFVSWGSGMNVLESYLAIPFIKLFGLSVVTIRLPQLIFACISIPVFYLLLKELYDEKVATAGVLLLSISPWHIMMSRWGLESNLAPAFLLFGFFFLLKGIKKNYMWVFAALMFGTALYAYAITWAFVPLLLFACGTYIILGRQKISIWWLVLSIFVLFLLALPLILFVLVNNGYINEIKTSFFSVPKLLVMRNSDISIECLIKPETYRNFIKVILMQDDGLPWNTISEYGLFYGISIIFVILGFCKSLYCAVQKVKQKMFSVELLCVIASLCSVICCLMINNLNTNRANTLHFFTLIYLAVGISEVCSWCKNRVYIKYSIALVYVICFVSFTTVYFGNYNETIGYYFNHGVGDSVNYLKEKGCTEVYVDSSIYHSQILFFDKTPVDEYLDTVEFKNYPAAYLSADEFTNYKFGIDFNNLSENSAYIFKADNVDYFVRNDFEVVTFGNYAVAYMDG